jgi:hypothetical protein
MSMHRKSNRALSSLHTISAAQSPVVRHLRDGVIRRAVRGNHAAIDQLAREFRPQMVAHAEEHMARFDMDAEDVVQNVFLALLERALVEPPRRVRRAVAARSRRPLRPARPRRLKGARPMRPNIFRVNPSILAPKVERLARIIRNPRSLSEDYFRAIRALEATRHEDAALVIGSLLDMPGPVGDEAVRALVSLATCGGPRCGQAVAEDCCIRLDASFDADEIRNAYRVLAALGDETSQRALAADCWADAEAKALKLAA